MSTRVSRVLKFQRFCPNSFVLPNISVNPWGFIVLINFGFHFSFRGLFFYMSWKANRNIQHRLDPLQKNSASYRTPLGLPYKPARMAPSVTVIRLSIRLPCSWNNFPFLPSPAWSHKLLRNSAHLSSFSALLASPKFQFMIYESPIQLFLVPLTHVLSILPVIPRHLIKVSKQKASFIKHFQLKK